MNPRDVEERKRLCFRRISGPRGWIRTTAHDIVIAGGNPNLDENGKGKSDGKG